MLKDFTCDAPRAEGQRQASMRQGSAEGAVYPLDSTQKTRDKRQAIWGWLGSACHGACEVFLFVPRSSNPGANKKAVLVNASQGQSQRLPVAVIKRWRNGSWLSHHLSANGQAVMCWLHLESLGAAILSSIFRSSVQTPAKCSQQPFWD